MKNKEQFPEVMIFGEPTNNEALVGSKGLIEYEIDFKGLKAHSSNPDKGISANLNAVKFLRFCCTYFSQSSGDHDSCNSSICKNPSVLATI